MSKLPLRIGALVTLYIDGHFVEGGRVAEVDNARGFRIGQKWHPFAELGEVVPEKREHEITLKDTMKDLCVHQVLPEGCLFCRVDRELEKEGK